MYCITGAGAPLYDDSEKRCSASWANSTFLTGIDNAHARHNPRGTGSPVPLFFHQCGSVVKLW